MATWRIVTKNSGSLLRRVVGTKAQAQEWVDSHYIKGFYKVVRETDKRFVVKRLGK